MSGRRGLIAGAAVCLFGFLALTVRRHAPPLRCGRPPVQALVHRTSSPRLHRAMEATSRVAGALGNRRPSSSDRSPCGAAAGCGRWPCRWSWPERASSRRRPTGPSRGPAEPGSRGIFERSRAEPGHAPRLPGLHHGQLRCARLLRWLGVGASIATVGAVAYSRLCLARTGSRTFSEARRCARPCVASRRSAASDGGRWGRRRPSSQSPGARALWRGGFPRGRWCAGDPAGPSRTSSKPRLPTLAAR